MNQLSYIVKDADAGGFKAVASTASVDRDGESIAAHAFDPLPVSIPVHLHHNIQQLAGSATPYYKNGALLVDGVFAKNSFGQEARDLILSGHLRHMSVMFRAPEYRNTSGVRTIVRAELLACDLVSVPANPEALVLSARSYSGAQAPSFEYARAKAFAEIALAEAQLLLDDLAFEDRMRAAANNGRAREFAQKSIAEMNSFFRSVQ